jgi:hypothetical protein
VYAALIRSRTANAESARAGSQFHGDNRMDANACAMSHEKALQDRELLRISKRFDVEPRRQQAARQSHRTPQRA